MDISCETTNYLRALLRIDKPWRITMDISGETTNHFQELRTQTIENDIRSGDYLLVVVDVDDLDRP
ncbi:hypothetical protein F444_18618 [Phytophthora nicotianae P1976]|uniref:Uncharacterized protein n=1 Tax=Phytophthora nicotianae P1976 TaxID=1317066 RepID=A0A080ZAT4_PHYNI|nr:hypothetical protein F444_18618 [Phytophthora nicotianae P1976]